MKKIVLILIFLPAVVWGQLWFGESKYYKQEHRCSFCNKKVYTIEKGKGWENYGDNMPFGGGELRPKLEENEESLRVGYWELTLNLCPSCYKKYWQEIEKKLSETYSQWRDYNSEEIQWIRGLEREKEDDEEKRKLQDTIIDLEKKLEELKNE